MVNCSYNSLWMGQFVRTDWDMFQSDHVCAAFHAASRAVSGSPIYVSDSLGGHDFALLKTLVFSDGTLPLCLHYALPTRDCLFKNPLSDQETVLKMWNLNKAYNFLFSFMTSIVRIYFQFAIMSFRSLRRSLCTELICRF